MKHKKLLIWSIIALLFVVSVIRHFSWDMFVVDLLQRYTFIGVVAICVGCILWFFVKDVLLQKSTKK